MPKLCLIAAIANNRVIGANNRLPWDLPDDLNHFMRTTWGLPCIMGLNTYTSIGRALPGRRCIVVSTTVSALPDAEVARSLTEAISLANEDDCARVFVIGGESLYREALPLAEELHLTLIRKHYPGDRFFPEVPLSQWRLTSETRKEAPQPYGQSLRYAFNVYQRVA